MNKKFNFKIMKWANDLFPICRSLTGEGNRKTLRYIKKINRNFKIKNFKSGEKFYDWKIPLEWKIKNAYIKDKLGLKIIDFKKNNLYVLNYSTPIKKRLNFLRLKKNIFTLKKSPSLIPYATSYYKRRWGFCMEYKKFKNFRNNQKFDVLIDSKHFKGKMDYAELVIKGKSKKTILICSYICHPSLANNELSGPLVLTALSKILKPSKYTIKLLLIPETIGAIAYIKKNLNFLRQNLVAGINISCVGDKGKFSLISSLSESTYADKISLRILKKKNFKKYSFLDRGSNERQFGCQNLNLPFVTICRSRFGDYKQYHTSADNLKILSEKNLRESTILIRDIIYEIQKNRIFLKNTTCEPFLTKYNLVNLIGGPKKDRYFQEIQNIVAYAGKDFDIKELSIKLKINFKKVLEIIMKLKKIRILKEFL
tara:strand:- start:1937 stop:3211 length:1275 start_codon:yes stop_codon:yes gene_type:complete